MPPQRARDINRHGWRSWKLKLWCTIPLLLIEIGILATIIALAVVSQEEDGFVDVSSGPLGHIVGHIVPQQLLWTSLPAFFMALLNIAYAMIANSTAERQPYVELVGEPERSNAKMTILLDYPSYPTFYNWIVATRNHHFHLGAALLVHFLCSFSLVPLTGSLFRDAETTRSHPVSLKALNEISFQGLSEQTNLQSAIDLAGAIHAFGAQAPTWVTTKYAFDPFVTAEAPKAGNISAMTWAYHVEPNCRIVDLSPTGPATNSSGSGSTSFQFIDRGCSVDTGEWPTVPERRSYTYTWYQFCGAGKFRIGIFAGLYSAEQPSNLANATVISCSPELLRTRVTLTMAFDTLGARSILSYSEKDTSRLESFDFQTMNSNVRLYRLSGFSGDFQSDSFGNAVHAYAAVQRPEAEFQEDVHLAATTEVYTTMVAVLANTALMRPRAQDLDLRGSESISITRLYVSIAVAAVIGALLGLMIACTIWLMVYVGQRPSVLTEEPIGLIGRALVLLRSNQVMDLIAALELQYPEGQLIAKIKRNFTLKESKCWLEGGSGNVGRQIRLEGLRVQPGDRETPRWRRKFTKGSRAAPSTTGRGASSSSGAPLARQGR